MNNEDAGAMGNEAVTTQHGENGAMGEPEPIDADVEVKTAVGVRSPSMP